MTDTQTMRAELDRLLTEFGNLQFDCGEWDEEMDRAESYKSLNKRAKEAREAVYSFFQAALARKPAEQVAGVGLTVWEGAMPESNGKSNFTAVLHRKESKGFDLFTDGFQFARSEYQDRVRYEADFMRWMIGEFKVKPELWDECYDMDKHSGYKAPAPEPVSVPVKWEDRHAADPSVNIHDHKLAEIAEWRALAAERGWVK